MRELSLNILDIVQNSIKANASLIQISIEENFDTNTMTISIDDNGKGMTKEQLEEVTNPFFTTRTTRKVGLGIPFFKMAAEMTGGNFEINSTLGVGTTLKACFNSSNIDMTPLGDISDTVLIIVSSNTAIDFLYTRAFIKNEEIKSNSFDTREIKAVLGEEVSLNEPEVVLWMKEYLAENMSAE